MYYSPGPIIPLEEVVAIMVIENDVILYFTGTGNSLQVSKDIRDELSNLELCKLTTEMVEEGIQFKGQILGIIFPVIYARMPRLLERVIERLEVASDAYVFAVATHGGAPAEVLTKLSRVLKCKEIVLNAGFLVHMPGNNIFAYGASNVEKQNKLFLKEKQKVKYITQAIEKRKDCQIEVSKLFLDTLIDRTFIKTTDNIVANLHQRDEQFWVNNHCTLCSVCETICPVQNIQIIGDKPVWQHRCEQCTACIQYCPSEALQWGKKTQNRKRYRNPNV